MKKMLFLVLLTVFQLMTIDTTWGQSTGTVTIDSPIQNYQACGDVTVTGSYAVTTADNCWWDIYTWASACAYVYVTVDGNKTFFGSVDYYHVGTDIQFGIPISMVNGEKHTIKIEMQAVMTDGSCGVQGGCAAFGDIIAQDSRDITSATDDPCCGDPTCGGSGPGPGPLPGPPPDSGGGPAGGPPGQCQ